MATDKTQQTISDAEKAAQSTAERATRVAQDAGEKLSEYGSSAQQRLRETGRYAAERTREYADDVGSYVTQKPIVSLAIALGAGILLGMLARGRG